MKLKFKDVLPNPFRDLKGNPPLKEKIEELKTSIATTGFWDNVVVRKNKDGKYERAYGEHRVRAAIEAGLIEADFIIKDLSDALMIQIMDNENREIYASSPASMIESVKAVVNALSDGSIPPFFTEEMLGGKNEGGVNNGLRYAPSYIPASECPDKEIRNPKVAYTAAAIARFLGRTKKASHPHEKDRPTVAVQAALDYLYLKELGKISSSILIKDERPIAAFKLAEITTNLKQRHVAEVVRRGKTQEELAKLREEQLAMQKKIQADTKKAEEDHKALLKKLADAQRAENEKKADELKAKLKAEDKRAQEKEVLNKLRAAELEEKLEKKKAWEAEQRQQDAYLPLRRDAENFIKRYETKITESNPEREEVKALNRTLIGGVRLTPADRARAQRAIRDYANWIYDWVLPQLSPELKAAQKRTVDSRKATQPKPKTKGGA